MVRAEAAELYAKALRQGRKTCRGALAQGRYPYLQALDEMLPDASARRQTDLGTVEIPMERIAGTKSGGRKTAFAADFMPLMDADTEFAAKWTELCVHLAEEGIRDPIQCCEYLGRFYVREGNKRVSVLKSLGAPTAPARVLRILPPWSEDEEIRAYYDFLDAYEKTRLYQVSFSHAGRFAKLQTALGYEPDHVWTEEERRTFMAGYARFEKALRARRGEKPPITPCDALLVWLRVYPFSYLRAFPEAELGRTLEAVWEDVLLLARPDPIALATEAPSSAGGLGRVLKNVFPGRLSVAFISNLRPEESDWARGHDLGRQYLEAILGDRVTVQAFHGVDPGKEADEAIARAAESGAQAIFATTPTLIGACRRAAARYPNLRVLNCSASMPYAGVRTYYSRIYEGKFITGALAGALSPTGRIGYVASYPIFGVPAGINAFALGVQMTNPRARVTLRWSCAEEDAMERLAAEGADFISNRDLPTPDRMREPWGLCRVEGDGRFRCVASPYWHWGNFYVKLARLILDGGWDAPGPGDPHAVNYWWGMSSRVVDVQLGEGLPPGARQLAELLREKLMACGVTPFRRTIRAQDGTVKSDGTTDFTPEELLNMDWLCDSVEGRIPPYEELLPKARPLARLLGLYRDGIPPMREDPIL